MKTRKQRLNPSKLLLLLLYGSYPYMDVKHMDSETKELTFLFGKFAKLMRVRNKHILEYLDWLESMGFITIIKKTKLRVTIIVTIPNLFKEIPVD